jgi:hypothetical protein
MFTPPVIPTVDESLLISSELLQASNNHLANLKKFRAEQFQRFWYKSKFVLRTPDELNAILEKMDNSSPGQSIKFFQAAAALAQLILAIDPGSLQNEDWYPLYEYTVDPIYGTIRIDPLPEPEPEPPTEPDPE